MGMHCPGLHFFFPRFSLQVPFWQVAHSEHAGTHSLVVVASVCCTLATPTMPPRSVRTAPRRECADVSVRTQLSNRSPSIGSLLVPRVPHAGGQHETIAI